MTLTFFSNMKVCAIFTALGYFFLFGTALWVKQIELEWMGMGITVVFLVLALYYVTRQNNKEYNEIKRL